MSMCESIHRDGFFVKMVGYAEMCFEVCVDSELRMRGMNLLRKHYRVAMEERELYPQYSMTDIYAQAQMRIIEETFEKYGLRM